MHAILEILLMVSGQETGLEPRAHRNKLRILLQVLVNKQKLNSGKFTYLGWVRLDP